jgi:hypothetical protein
MPAGNSERVKGIGWQHNETASMQALEFDQAMLR